MSSLIQVAPAAQLCAFQTANTKMPPNTQQIPQLPYMVAVGSGDCDDLIRLCEYIVVEYCSGHMT